MMIDLKKDPTYKAKQEPQIIEVPQMQFVMVDGRGAPTPEGEYGEAMQIIYGIVYTIKFWDKKHKPPMGYDKFTMPPIETLWWMEDGSPIDANKKDQWVWTSIHRLPDFVTSQYFKEVVSVVCEQKKSDIYKKGRLEKFTEGLSVQILHIGPYDQETENIEWIHRYAKDEGYELHGKHHEMYFSDPRRVAPEKLKTIIRQPIKK